MNLMLAKKREWREEDKKELRCITYMYQFPKINVIITC